MTRRKFLGRAGTAFAASAFESARAAGKVRREFTSATDSAAEVKVLNRPPMSGGNNSYIGNRPPLLESPLIKLPIGSIEPRGWLRQQLELMASGMTGQLAEHSMFLQPTSGWLTFGEKDPGWEEMPYWLRGYGDLGYVLKDDKIVREARRWLDAALSSQQQDGYFGPLPNKAEPDLWPNMLMLNAFQSLYEWNGDKRILPFMLKYARYELNLPREKLLPGSWQKVRGGDNLASVYWLYNRTGEPWLLDLARALHERTADWTSGPQTHHGVNNAQGFREPATYYQQARDRKFLEATERNYAVVMGEYGQMPGGMFAADENWRAGHTGPEQAAETCSMVEFMHSFEMLSTITGDPVWADRCENVAFNSLPAALTPDLKALHYLTASNLVQCDPGKEHVFDNDGYMLPFSPSVVYRCCQHNVAMGWPYFSEHLWMATEGNGLAAVFYAPGAVEALVGQGARVRIEEETTYPFDETVDFNLATPEPVRFPLLLRVPGWCEGASVEVNGRTPTSAPALAPGTYVQIERAWQDGDHVSLHLPMRIELKTWAKQANAVSVNRGPLSYSLKIEPRWEKTGGTDNWPELAVYPATTWNVGLEVNKSHLSATFELVKRPLIGGQPFDLATAPLELHGKGRVVPQWTLFKNCAGPLPPSPVRSEEPEQGFGLVPMGCARLRVSVFPTLG